MARSSSSLKRFVIPSIFFGLYLLNVIAAKVQFLTGNTSVIRVGDVGEFLFLLCASVSFVIATLLAEKDAGNESSS